MTLNPHLAFNGQCEASFKFYEKSLGGKITFMMNYAKSPVAAQFPSDWGNRIMHASLTVGANMLSGSDAPPDRYEKPQGFCVSLGLKDVIEGERIFKALSENGTVQMPFEKTFWAAGFGMLTDQFGIPWIINCEE